MIRLEGISKKYGRRAACSDISFTAPRGEITALAGTNGAGKSTIMGIIAGVIGADGGKVFLDDLDAAADPAGARAITGTLFENNPLYGDLTVFEHLVFSAGMFGYEGKRASVAASGMIELCELESSAHRVIKNLSRGLRQRTGLALALVHDPQVLILDEPTQGLDPIQLETFRTILQSLRADKTILLSTHAMQEVESLCDRIVVIDGGVIAEEGTIEDIKRVTNTASVAEAFLSIVPRHSGEISS
jgi:ABC-2 type transport system ATP-binding protein